MGGDLQRFVVAQDPVYEAVIRELTAGRKRSHWMWYIFPQIAGLGSSRMAREYAIQSREEAEAYSKRAILGPRLTQCTQLVLAVPGCGVDQIFGYPDNLKFRSCMTLFEACASDNAVFSSALEKYFGGEPDRQTLDILKTQMC